MTIHNNAAPLGRDPIHEAIDILTVAADELHNAHTINPDDWTGEPEAKAEYERTLRVVAALSKLRKNGAQPFDEEAPPIAPNDEAISECWITASDSDGIAYNDPSFERGYRAALASAPVAGAALSDLQALQWAEKHGLQWALKHPDGIREVIADAQRLAAPQTGGEPLARYCPGCGSVGPVGDEYRDCCPDGNQARMIPKRLAEQCRDTFRLAIQSLLPDAPANEGGAPQASEAVRILFPTHLRKMWSGGEVQPWLDEHQGITPPNARGKGSLERYRKWQTEQTQADKDGCANN